MHVRVLICPTFFVIPSLPRNPAKRKNIINAPMAGFSGLRCRSALNDVGGRSVRVRVLICPYLFRHSELAEESNEA